MAYIDASRTLAPRDWVGSDERTLWIIRPPEAARAAWCADVLLRSGSFALVVLVNQMFRAIGDETTLPAFAASGILSAGDSTTVVVDFTYATAPSSTAFTLNVTTMNL